MVRITGYMEKTDPDPQRSKGQVSIYKNDCVACCHCGRIIKLIKGDPKPFRIIWEQNVKKMSVCRNCMQPVCTPCTSLPCDPIEKKLERAEKGSL